MNFFGRAVENSFLFLLFTLSLFLLYFAIDVSPPLYVIKVKSSNDDWGTLSCDPVLNYYEKGSQVTIRANPKPGYFFESWTGEETSNNATYTFTVKSNVNAVARFLPNGIVMDSDIIGYTTVQDDKEITYFVAGGKLSDTVQATSLAELQLTPPVNPVRESAYFQ